MVGEELCALIELRAAMNGMRLRLRKRLAARRGAECARDAGPEWRHAARGAQAAEHAAASAASRGHSRRGRCVVGEITHR